MRGVWVWGKQCVCVGWGLCGGSNEEGGRGRENTPAKADAAANCFSAVNGWMAEPKRVIMTSRVIVPL